MLSKLIQASVILFVILFILQGCSMQKLQRIQQNAKASVFEQLDFHALVKRYLKKDKANSLEGIYSVSGTVTKKGKGFLGSAEKEKTIDRRENYAQVAILRDPGDTGRDYIEISLVDEKLASYSVVGEFTAAASGNILVYKHIDAKGKTNSFTFTFDQSTDLLEGVRVDNEGNSTVTYKLTYVKMYPK